MDNTYPARGSQQSCGGFTKIDNALLDADFRALGHGLDNESKLLWVQLRRYDWADRRDAHPSVPTLAASMGHTERWVQDHLRRLQSAGLLDIVPRPGTTNRYLTHWPPTTVRGEAQFTPGVHHSSPLKC